MKHLGDGENVPLLVREHDGRVLLQSEHPHVPSTVRAHDEGGTAGASRRYALDVPRTHVRRRRRHVLGVRRELVHRAQTTTRPEC